MDEEFPGTPTPAPGVRVSFDANKFIASRGRHADSSTDRTVRGPGLLVHEDLTAVFALPNRLWRVDDLNGVIRDSHRPSSPWLWSTTLTVHEELPNWRVMGPHGDTVMQLIGQVRALTDEQAQAIGTMDAAEETRIVGACADRLRQATRAYGFPIIGCGWAEAHNAASKGAQRASTRPFARTDPDDPGTEDLADPAWVQA